MYPFYEKLVKAGLVNVCIHKGLFPPQVETNFPNLLGYSNVADVRGGKGFASAKFHHLPLRLPLRRRRDRGTGLGAIATHRTGRVGQRSRRDPRAVRCEERVWRSRAVFAQSTMADPRVCAFTLGTMIKGMGEDHVVRGSDTVWTGSPQWQIEALRRLDIPDEMQKKYGFKPLGPADGQVKRAILGDNNARLYNFTPQQRSALENDRFAEIRENYKKEGDGRSNRTYGYILKPTA